MKHTLKFHLLFCKVTTSIIVAIAACSTTFAQITVTNSTFPAIGDTLKIAFDYLPISGVNPITAPGGPQTWDFSSLQFDAIKNIVHRPTNEGSAQVTGADLVAITSPNWEEYYKVTTNSYELVADYGSHYDLVGNTLFNYTPSIPERRAPMNFFDINVINTSSVIYTTTPAAFPPALIAAFDQNLSNFEKPYDSLRYRIQIKRNDVVDAYGSLTIPGGTYNVLRERRTKEMSVELDIRSLALEWIGNLLSVASNSGFQGLGLSETFITYNFYTDLEKEPIAIVEYFGHCLVCPGGGDPVLQQVSFKLNPEALPVELTSFTALSAGSRIILNWQTATEVNNYGFEIQRKEINDEWKKLAFVNGHGNSNSPKSYSYEDNNPVGGTKIWYRLKQIDNDGRFEFSKVVEVSYVPSEFTLYQNYPNPFNPVTKIKYSLPVESDVTIKVFDILGNEVSTLIHEKQEAGAKEVEFNGKDLVSGVYIYQIQAGQFTQTKRMLLMK